MNVMSWPIFYFSCYASDEVEVLFCYVREALPGHILEEVLVPDYCAGPDDYNIFDLLVEWTRISPSGYATQVYKVLQAAL
jgi:hypothetical protein